MQYPMKKIITLSIAALILLTFIPSFAQFRFEGGINAGATIPTGDYSGTMTDFYYGKNMDYLPELILVALLP